MNSQISSQPLNALVDDFIKMNQSGQVLALCKKYYHEQVLMLNNGDVFASSMAESYQKQQGFISSVKAFKVRLVEKLIVENDVESTSEDTVENTSEDTVESTVENTSENIVELTFCYQMTSSDNKVTTFTGKHVQTWQQGKIIKEEYLSI